MSIMRGLTHSSARFSSNQRFQSSGVVRILTASSLAWTHAPLAVHILSGDLILHKRTLGPVKALIYALRHYDADRTAASLDDVPVADNQKVAGYMSHKAKIYLVGSFFFTIYCGLTYSPCRLMCTTT
jgi:hypothetical protein